MRRATTFLFFVIAAPLAIACTRTTTQRAEPAREPTTTTTQREGTGTPGTTVATASACPIDVTGTTLTAQDTDHGIDLVFTTNAGDANVTELRNRVHAMARMHEQHRVAGTDRPRHRMMKMPDSNVTAVDVTDGAKLSFEPVDPTDLETLRLHVRQIADQERGMGAGMHGARDGCPMLQMMMHGGPEPVTK